MKLIIDNKLCEALPGESIYDITKRLGFVNGRLSNDPIAAKISGRVFTLGYVPVREKDMTPERKTIRTAMSASDGNIKLLRYSDPQGREAYMRTAQFVIFLAIETLWPHAVAKMSCTVGTGVYFKVTGAENFSVEKLRAKIDEIIEADLPLVRRKIPTADAIAYYEKQGYTDKAKLLRYRKNTTFKIYESGEFRDYFYGEMAPSTSFLRSFDIIPSLEGFIFILPDIKNPDKVSTFRDSPNFFSVYTEGKDWGELMGCETVADLNELVKSGKIRELIRVNEALHEKKFSEIADMI